MTDVKFSIDYLTGAIGPSSVRFNFKFSSGTTFCFWDDIEHHDRSCDIDDMEMIKYLDDFMSGKTSKFEFRVGMDTSTFMSFQKDTYNDYWVETRTTEGSAVISRLCVPVDATELFQALSHLRSYFQDSQMMHE